MKQINEKIQETQYNTIQYRNNENYKDFCNADFVELKAGQQIKSLAFHVAVYYIAYTVLKPRI